MHANVRHVIKAQQFQREILEAICKQADQFQDLMTKADHKHRPLMNWFPGRTLIALFYEPSTRTRVSFEMAGLHLGMNVVSSESAGQFSSAIKGETIEDTIRVLAEYRPDAIVMRHNETGAAERAADVSAVPIINGGDGTGQHPTQTILDLYTIQRELGQVDDLTIVIGGDLKHGRTARSLAYLLSKFNGVRLIFVSPPVLRMGDDIKAHLTEHNVPFEEQDTLHDILPHADVVYWTRIQKERLGNDIPYESVRDKFVITPSHMEMMKKRSILMHPLPRVNEITQECDKDPRAAYFRQAGNGLYVRMALIQWVLEGF